jgi:hypothetical protein
VTTSPAAHHLTTIRALWIDLDDALDQHGTNWLASRADLFATLDQGRRRRSRHPPRAGA